MGILSSLGTAGLGLAAGAASSAIGSSIQHAYSKKAARREYKYKQHWARTGPTLVREGLEAAGINPIFAAGGIAGGATSSTPSVSAPGTTDPASSGSKLARLGPERSLLQQQTATSAAQEGMANEARRKTSIENKVAMAELPKHLARGEVLNHPLGRKAVQIGILRELASNAAPSLPSLLGGGLVAATHYGTDTMSQLKKLLNSKQGFSQSTLPKLSVPTPKPKKQNRFDPFGYPRPKSSKPHNRKRK